MPYFPPLPKVPDIDFRPWTTYQSQAHVVELYGNPPNKPAQAWADWLSKTEQYLLQENPWAAQGGLHLVPQAKAHTWRKGRPAYWEQLRAVLHLALQQPVTTCTGPVQSFTQRTRHAHRHWVEAPRWGQFLDTCHHWHRYRDPHAAELLLQTIGHQLREAQQEANEETSLQYRQWLQEGYQKGLKGLFRSLKSSELAWERPYRMSPIQCPSAWVKDWLIGEACGRSDRTTHQVRGPVFNKQRNSKQPPLNL